MSLIEEIARCRSVAIAGLSKNAGKTECLNYILRKGRECGHGFAVTSIGIDGESKDQVSETAKPEITLAEGTIFVTSEAHYRQRRLTSEILDVSRRQTSLGRLVTARVLIEGKVILSGPPDTFSMKRIVSDMEKLGVRTTLVDGALSRLSLSAPSLAEALVLATGAAVAPGIPAVVEKTKFVYDTLSLPQVDSRLSDELKKIDKGIHSIDADGKIWDLGIRTAFLPDSKIKELFSHGSTIYVAGAVTDRLLENLRRQKEIGETVLIMRDFTRMFASRENFYGFLRKGGAIKVVDKNRLIAICVNPFSPQGFHIDSLRLKSELEKFVDVPVYDVRLTEE